MAAFRLDVKRSVLRFLREYDVAEAAKEMTDRLLSLTTDAMPPESTPVEEVPGLRLLTVRGMSFLYRVNEAKGVISVYSYQAAEKPDA